jgi:hypothetical protein
MSIITIPHLEGRTSAAANLQLKKMLLRNCISAYPHNYFQQYATFQRNIALQVHNVHCTSAHPQSIVEARIKKVAKLW